MSRAPALTLAALSCLALAAGGAPPGLAKDYLLTGAKPDQLVMVDPAARAVEKSCSVPDAGTGILTIVPAPDASTAYVIANHWESVAGIDLDSCEQVFRADLSSGDERVKATFGMAISPDGSELFVFQSPVKLLPGEYQVQPTRIAVYDTTAGVGAEPIRSFEAPRRTAILALSGDGTKLYAVSWDIYVLDPQTGDRAPPAAQLAARELQRARRARRVAAVGGDRHLHQPLFRAPHRPRPGGRGRLQDRADEPRPQ